MLKQILVLASGKDDRMLRGKAMECISLIGIAVRYRLTTARVSRARATRGTCDRSIAHRRVVCLSASSSSTACGRCVGTLGCWRKVKGGPGLGHAQVGKEIFQHEAKEVMHMMNSLQSSEMEPDDPQVRPSVDRSAV